MKPADESRSSSSTAVEESCPICEGSGERDDGDACRNCSGSGVVRRTARVDGKPTLSPGVLSRCPVCGMPVYRVDAVQVDGKNVHRWCEKKEG